MAFTIFLDIDGVLLSYLHLKVFDPVDGEQAFKKEAIESLNKIIRHYKADLCVVSSYPPSVRSRYPDFKQFMIRRGIEVNGLTFGDEHDRYNFVLGCIKDGMKDYLIIDDEAHGYYALVPQIEYKRILRVNSYRCLDEFDFLQVTRGYDLNKK